MVGRQADSPVDHPHLLVQTEADEKMGRPNRDDLMTKKSMRDDLMTKKSMTDDLMTKKSMTDDLMTEMSRKDDQDVYEDQDTDERWPKNNCS
jgi:hypothetical protein